MRRMITWTAMVAILCSVARADDKKADRDQVNPSPNPSQFDPKAMQELMMKLAQPGPQHERFKQMVGDWNCAVRTYCDPETGNTLTTPTESKGQAKFTLELGGRFLQQRFTGEFQGMKFEGLGLCGSDNGNQKYVGTWVDNMGTGIMHNEGTFDERTQTLHETGTYEMPGMTMTFKLATKYVSENEFLFTMAFVEGGQEKKMMEMTYTRKK
jgi:hypothetical protein